jgi:hypothetical protein
MYLGESPVAGERKSFSSSEFSAAAPRPVFLHGLWRSGSTYLWSRFRTSDAARCFYEPLHHGLARLTAERIAHDTPEKIGGNRHPALSEPYFREFAPLIGLRGVRGFREDLAYERFALRPAEAHSRLERYVGGLIDHAAQEGLTAVLGFNRTGLRIAWLKAHFPEAINIHIDRDPAAIWASYVAEMEKGNYAFFSMWLRVLMGNADHPVFAPLVERLGLFRRALVHGSAKAVHRQIMQGMSASESYFMVYYLWLACTEHAKAESDLVVDTRQAVSGRYRRHIAEALSASTGVAVNIDDMRCVPARASPPCRARARIELSAEAMLPVGALPRAARLPPPVPHDLRAHQRRDASLLAKAV